MVRVTTGRHLRTPLVYQSAYQSVRFPWDSGARWRPSATLMTRYSKQRVVDGMEEVRGSSPLSSTVVMSRDTVSRCLGTWLHFRAVGLKIISGVRVCPRFVMAAAPADVVNRIRRRPAPGRGDAGRS